jgi:hypothetical protein
MVTSRDRVFEGPVGRSVLPSHRFSNSPAVVKE